MILQNFVVNDRLGNCQIYELAFQKAIDTIKHWNRGSIHQIQQNLSFYDINIPGSEIEPDRN